MTSLREMILASDGTIETFSFDTVMVNEGQENMDLYYVLSGKLDGVIKINDKNIRVYSVAADEFIGLFSFFEEDKISVSTVIGLTPGKVIKINPNAYEKLLHRFDNFQVKILTALSHQYRKRLKQLSELHVKIFRIMEQKIQLEKMAFLGRVSASLAHEINNSVTVVAKGIEMMQEEIPSLLTSTLNPLEKDIWSWASKRGNKLSPSDVRKQVQKQSTVFPTIDQQKLKKGIEIRDKHPDLSLEEILRLSHDNLERLHRINTIGTRLVRVAQAGEHLVHIVKRIRILGKPPEKIVAVNVQNTIEQSLSLLKDRLEYVDVIIKQDVTERVYCSPHDLMQLWNNLIINAVKAMEGIGKIEISFQHRGKFLIISLTDTGAGIPESMMETVFEPQITTKTKISSHCGLGLGLAICKQMVTSYGGTIRCVHCNKGASFRIALPRVHTL